MRVLFLDIDGVLNSREYDARCAMTGGDLMQPDPRLVVRLMGIVQETDAKIVLTTSWRLDKSIEWPFPVYDRTPRGDAFGCRAEEIKAWLVENHGDYADFVIIDDEPDAGVGFSEHFVQTNPQTGLTAEDAATIVGLFT